MKDTITNAAEITILQPIDNNYKTGGGDISIGGALIVASRGQPFKPIAIYGGTTDIEDNFGLPLPKKVSGMEGLRHVHDASESCSYVNVVRVVNALTYRFPSVAFLICRDLAKTWASGESYEMGDVVEHDGKKYLCAYPNTAETDNAPDAEGQTDWLEFTGPVENNAHRYNEEVVVGDGAFMVVYPIDGDSSVNRSIEISNIDKEAHRFTLSIYDRDSLGEAYLLEQHIVGVDEDDKDDMGLSAYIEKVFERESDRFRVDYMEGVTWNDIEDVLVANESTRVAERKFQFKGGMAGDERDNTDWQLGVNVFRDERIACNLLFAAGIYEPDIIVALASVADSRHIAFFYDIPHWFGSKCGQKTNRPNRSY